MKRQAFRFIQRLMVYCGIAMFAATASGQGMVIFDGWAGLSSSYYTELGIRFQVVVPAGTSGEDALGIISPGYQNHPQNTSSYMLWYGQYNPHDYVSLSLVNGSFFGLTSVWLADPTAPSPSPVSILFIGHRSGGGAVTSAFTTPGNGATTFATYTFNSDFTSPVFTHVDILAPRWAMDNLVFTIPEPSAFAIVGLGVITCMVRMRKRTAPRSRGRAFLLQ